VAVKRWQRGPHAIEMIDEPCYSFGSVDNTRHYDHEFVLVEPLDHLVSKHGLQCFFDGDLRASAVLGAAGGATGVHQRSCVLLADRALVAVGDRLAALRLPDLRLLWQVRADGATCFGLHAVPDERHVIVHGELDISRFTIEGSLQWKVHGRDILTGVSELRDGVLVVSDFNGEEYRIDIERGRRTEDG
jgi:hypothetical protein